MFSIQPIKQVQFKGYRQPDISTIVLSDKNTRDKYIKASKDVIGPDYVYGERSIFPFLFERIRKTINMMSSGNIAEDARKIREGLDLIA